ncbi:hypothetical protein MUN77_15410 [Leucobacter allii]|uniref:hypothetical protein n=1 Tax=Leucobacter allii TaxID=2932247 RepID=UPI001FD264DB|nr:hypothetical protein [Leucobacter allii]UOR01495.1 hypothetical protein MUN77_15410 [Leucobacter allii]
MAAGALPTPDDGWARVLLQAGAVAGLWAIATFLIAAAALPQMDPQCYSDSPTGGRVCPLQRDPVLTHLFDVRWPAVPEAVTVSGVLLTMLLGIGLAIFLDTSEPWSERGGAPTAAGIVSGLLGGGLGLLVAGPGFVHPLIALGVTALGALLALLGSLALRAFLRALRRRYAGHLRREQLREHGTRTVSRITSLDWQYTYPDDDTVFTLTAEFDTRDGRRSVTEELCVPRRDAPVLGGTVIVVHDDDAAHATGIDALLALDPDGLRDPDALEKYPEAPESSPS